MAEEEIAEEQTEVEEQVVHLEGEDVMLRTHDEINSRLCGEIKALKAGHVIVELETSEDMQADSMGLVHSGFIYGAADYAAMLAVNEKNVVLSNSTSMFLSPVKVGDIVRFEAKAKSSDSKKRYIKVEGFILDVKVFEGEFKTIVTERHVLRLSLLTEEES